MAGSYSGFYFQQRENDDQRSFGSQDRQRYQGNQQNFQNRDWIDRTRDEVSSWFGDDEAQRRRRMDKQNKGLHKGKGPKDYQRSQERIREDISDRLSDDSHVDASEINVNVSEGEVTLTGTVDSKEAKRRAEDIAESVSGVLNVSNQLRVGKHQASSSTYGQSSLTGNQQKQDKA